MMGQTVDSLLESLLGATLRLEQAVIREDSDPDEWMPILDEREQLIGELQKSGLTGSGLSDLQRKQLEQVSEINQRILPLMDERKQGIQQKLNHLQRSKLALNTYNDIGPSGYGAFFDRKK